MKKIIYLLLMMLAVLVVSCDNTAKQDANNKTTSKTMQYDMAIMDKGQVILYDLTQRTAAPIEAETDSAFNMVFGSDRIYYSVKKGNNTLLKFVDLNDPKLQPQLAADWEVPYDCCVGTAYYCQEAPSLNYYPEKNILGMYYMQSPNYG